MSDRCANALRHAECPPKVQVSGMRRSVGSSDGGGCVPAHRAADHPHAVPDRKNTTTTHPTRRASAIRIRVFWFGVSGIGLTPVKIGTNAQRVNAVGEDDFGGTWTCFDSLRSMVLDEACWQRGDARSNAAGAPVKWSPPRWHYAAHPTSRATSFLSSSSLPRSPNG